MDIQGQRDLQLLTEVERNPSVTQRSLANQLGVALGLTNLYLKRLARKGYIKITTIPRNRIKYLLTPRGMAEKTRLTYEFMQYSLTYYRRMRQKLAHVLRGLADAGVKRVVIYGAGELAELAYLTLHGMDLTLVGFISHSPDQTFLSHPVLPVEALAAVDFDALLITDLRDADRITAELVRHGVPAAKIVPLVGQT